MTDDAKKVADEYYSLARKHSSDEFNEAMSYINLKIFEGSCSLVEVKDRIELGSLSSAGVGATELTNLLMTDLGNPAPQQAKSPVRQQARNLESVVLHPEGIQAVIEAILEELGEGFSMKELEKYKENPTEFILKNSYGETAYLVRKALLDLDEIPWKKVKDLWPAYFAHSAEIIQTQRGLSGDPNYEHAKLLRVNEQLVQVEPSSLDASVLAQLKEPIRAHGPARIINWMSDYEKDPDRDIARLHLDHPRGSEIDEFFSDGNIHPIAAAYHLPELWPAYYARALAELVQEDDDPQFPVEDITLYKIVMQPEEVREASTNGPKRSKKKKSLSPDVEREITKMNLKSRLSGMAAVVAATWGAGTAMFDYLVGSGLTMDTLQSAAVHTIVATAFYAYKGHFSQRASALARGYATSAERSLPWPQRMHSKFVNNGVIPLLFASISLGTLGSDMYDRTVNFLQNPAQKVHLSSEEILRAGDFIESTEERMYSSHSLPQQITNNPGSESVFIYQNLQHLFKVQDNDTWTVTLSDGEKTYLRDQPIEIFDQDNKYTASDDSGLHLYNVHILKATNGVTNFEIREYRPWSEGLKVVK